MQITPGKYRGFQRLGDARGVLKMVAIDQRNPILEPIKRKRGVAEAPYADVVGVKETLARFLSPKAALAACSPSDSLPFPTPRATSAAAPSFMPASRKPIYATFPLNSFRSMEPSLKKSPAHSPKASAPLQTLRWASASLASPAQPSRKARTPISP